MDATQNDLKLTLQDLEQCRFDHTKPPPPQVKVLTIQGKLILTRQNWSLIVGVPKAGKSTYSNIVMASACCMSELHSIHTHRHEDKPFFAHFDTEQAEYDMYNAGKNVLKLSNSKTLPKSYHLFKMREKDPEQIMGLIELYLQSEPKCGFILLDGLLDLVYNFNDEKECKTVINWLKRITSQYDIAMLCVLHTGKTSGQTIGHLGSFADRYCQSALEVTKIEGGQLQMKPKLMRSASDFMPMSIIRDDFSGEILPVDYTEWTVVQNNRTKKIKRNAS